MMCTKFLFFCNFRSYFTTFNHCIKITKAGFVKDIPFLLPRSPFIHKYFVYTSAENHSEDDDSLEKKIIYSSILHNVGFLEKKSYEKKAKRLEKLNASMTFTPVSLKYVLENKENNDSPKEENQTTVSNYLLNLPYTVKAVSGDVLLKNHDATENDSTAYEEEHIVDIPTRTVGKWMNDYEMYSDEEPCEEFVFEEWRRKYGTPNPSTPVSQVPCGGCGALLHCQDQSIPGYLPSEIFSNCGVVDLRELVCQRCHFLKNYNTALSVTVDSEVYPKLMSNIKDSRALVLLLADITDLPCSVWPGILDVIGLKRPLFLVGNKTDLIWGDRRGWMEHALRCLRMTLPKHALVKHSCLISAKNGYGVEELINKLHNIWQYKGDVYLVGCTNVGKSTLFNSLLQSDYCKVKVVDIIQRATTAPWPGTTLNLLKFPILRPEGWRLYLRTLRLQKELKVLRAERSLMKQQIMESSNKPRTPPQLVGHIGRTFTDKPDNNQLEEKDTFGLDGKSVRLGLNPDDPYLARTKWVYDTPGVLHKDQILDLLTTEEVVLTLPKRIIEPRTFLIRNGWSLFIGGLARLDYLQGDKSIRVTVFSSHTLPITITNVSEADEVYSQLLGTELLAIPSGPPERLATWQGLEKALEASFAGVDRNESCADVTLSSIGWVSITPDSNKIVKLAFWTPKARGVHVRNPPLLPYAVALRGRKHSKSPAYRRSRNVII